MGLKGKIKKSKKSKKSVDKVIRKYSGKRMNRTRSRGKSKRYSRNISLNRKLKGKRTKRKSFRKRNLKGGSKLLGSSNLRRRTYSEEDIQRLVEERAMDEEKAYRLGISGSTIFEVMEPDKSNKPTLFPVKIYISGKSLGGPRWDKPREEIISMRWSKWKEWIESLNKEYGKNILPLPKYYLQGQEESKKNNLIETLDDLKKALPYIAGTGVEITEFIYNMLRNFAEE